MANLPKPSPRAPVKAAFLINAHDFKGCKASQINANSVFVEEEEEGDFRARSVRSEYHLLAGSVHSCLLRDGFLAIKHCL